MIVNDDSALIFGRDSLGVPKKMGRVDVHLAGPIEVSVRRRGQTVLRITGTLGEHDASPPPLMGKWSTNVSGTVGLSIPQLIAFKPSEEVLAARRVDVDVSVAVSDDDPIHRLGIGEVIEARWYETNFGGGERFPPIPAMPVSPLYLIRNWDVRSR
jgi:acetoacetate decarboxylase